MEKVILVDLNLAVKLQPARIIAIYFKNGLKVNSFSGSVNCADCFGLNYDNLDSLLSSFKEWWYKNIDDETIFLKTEGELMYFVFQEELKLSDLDLMVPYNLLDRIKLMGKKNVCIFDLIWFNLI